MALFELAIARFGSVDIVVSVAILPAGVLSVLLWLKKMVSHRSQMQASTKANKCAGAT